MDTTGKDIQNGKMEIGLQGITLEVDESKLSAYLTFPQHSEGESLDLSELLKTLQENFKIKNINEQALVDAVTHWNDGAPCDEKILIAEGTPPTNGRDGTIEWSEDYFGQEEVDDDSTRVDFFSQSHIPIVKEGETIATITPPTKGLDGIDVYGNEIPAEDGKPQPVQIGDNLEIEEEGTAVVTKTQGQVVLIDDRVSVKEVLEIDGDVDYDVGKIDFPGTVIVKGNILDGFSVKAGEEIYVHGLVEGANLESGADMFLKGGVSGKSKGKIICGGKLTVRHLDNIEVEAEGDIEIANEIVNCNVTTKSAIILTRGSIIGGEIRAAKGGEVGVLGSDGIVRTKITIGRDFEIETEIEAVNEEMKSTKEKIKEVEERLQVEKHNISSRMTTKETNHNLKEALTQLISGLEELKTKLEELKAKKTELWEKVKTLRAEAVLFVRKMIYQGVLLDVGGERKEWDKDYSRAVKIKYNTKDREIELLGIT